MRVFKLISCLTITLGLIFLLDNRWMINGNPIPPIGKFLDPFNGFWRNIEPEDFKGKEVLGIRGLQDKVTVVYDSLAIPHIFAENDLDLYFAQGYVTAKHRLWQMEFQTHAAAGRVSEIIGAGKNDAYLQYDRGQRRLGMVFAAQQSLEALRTEQDALIMVERYSEGINAYIQSLTYKSLPFEYKLLHYQPELWSPLKCMLLSKSMAQTLNMGDKDMEMTNALQLFGREMVETLYPDREAVGDPIVDKPGQWKFKVSIPDSVPMAVPPELINIKKLPPADPTTGSNNWAVSGSKTATGSPILSGDPHLNLNLPSLWYVIQLQAPGTNSLGASLPGAPGIIIGCTDSIAWSVTNAQRDVVDWFKISFKDKTRNKYLLDSQWVSSEKVIETFRVRDKPVFYDTIVYTHWGPITYDRNFKAENNLNNYAFRWISHDPSDEIVAYYKLNRAKNHGEFMEAVDHFSSPAQNFVFASVSGDIAMRVQGKYPQRRSMEGKFVLDGTKKSNGWSAFIPTEQNVQDKNPSRGFVSSANQYPVDASYPFFITGTSFEAYRNRRINKVLSELDSIQPADMMRLQNDNYNLKAEESLPFFLSQLDSSSFTEPEKNAYKILSGWKYINNIESEGASYYEAWWNNLMPLLWDEMDNEKAILRRPTTFTTIRLLKEKPDLSLFDIQSTTAKEAGGDVIRKAFSLGVEDIENWRVSHRNSPAQWADYKDSYIGHLMRIEPLGIHVRSGGNRDIVNAHSRTHGPSWRMIVSLEKSGILMWGVYPGGQSGNPGSINYSKMVEHWVNGKYFPILFMRTPEDGANRVHYSTQLMKQK